MFRTRTRLAALSLIILPLTACSLASPQDSDPDVSQDPDADLTLLVHPTIYSALGGDDLVKDFSAEKGVDVQVVKADIGEHLEKLLTDERAGTGTYDLVALQNIDYMPRVTDGLYALDSYIESAPAEWDWNDFVESTRDYAAVDGTQYGVPVRLGMQMLYYRADLLSDAGIEPPATFNEYVEAAAQLTTDDVSGAVQRGVPRELANDWLGLLYSAGGTILENGECAVDNEAGVEAVSMLRSLYDDGSLPEDFFAMARDDYIAEMQLGHAAMGIYYSPYWSYLKNPEESTVADDVAFALSPVVEGVTPGTSRAQTWNLSISANSENRDMAWEFIQFATTKANSLNSGLELANGPVRESTYLDADYAAKFPVAETWLQAAKVAQSDPPIDQLPKIIDILATYVTAGIDGSSTPADALTAACTEIDQAME